MATAQEKRAAGPGGLIRDWRQRRRLSQLDLALEAEISTRHLSFVETGRARPSRELVLHLAEQLQVPLRERNTLLLAAGYAPQYAETPLDRPEMAAVRRALDRLLEGHEPFPALAVGRRWEIVATNRAAGALLEGVSPELLAAPVNALRVALHPAGLARRIINFDEWSEHLLSRLRRQVAASGDSALADLERELRTFPGVGAAAGTGPSPQLYVPLVLRTEAGDLRFLSTISTFGTALDITVADLSIESFFPADESTAKALQSPGGAASRA
jgi:transcriptional regulator with XRE-family HTH domain